MKIYIKSAGRKDTQDYAWVCVSGEGTPSDLDLISKVECSVPNQGIVHAVSAPENGQTALFLGNIRSDRTDFCGTPILNRLAVIYSENDHARQKVVQTLVSEWMSGTSELIPLLRDGIVRSGNSRGFDWTPDFLVGLKRIMGNDAGDVVQDNAAAHGCGNTSFQSPTTKESSKMRIAINTVPSGEDDYDWYFGERPAYAKVIWDICERVKASTAAKCFFAALHRQPGCWCLFLQDIIGLDKASVRNARGTISIEIPDDSPLAEEKARTLLAAWLTPNSPLLAIFKDNVDVSSETVVVKEADLYDRVAKLAEGEKLYDGTLPAKRLWYRVSGDLSNVNELRTYASQFVRRYKFGDQTGVHFLFTLCPYSVIPGDIDVLPDIPAKFIVLGWRDGEPGDTPDPAIIEPPAALPKTTATAKPVRQPPHGPVRQGAGHHNGSSVPNNFWLVVVAAAFVLLLVFFAFGRGCNSTIVPPKKKNRNDSQTVEKPIKDSAANDPSAKSAPQSPGAPSPDAASSVPSTRQNQPSRQ